MLPNHQVAEWAVSSEGTVVIRDIDLGLWPRVAIARQRAHNRCPARLAARLFSTLIGPTDSLWSAVLERTARDFYHLRNT